MEKSEKFDRVTHAVLKIMAQGTGKVTHTQVSKSANVSRAWLYKYIGKTSEALVEYSFKQLSDTLVKLGGIPTAGKPEELLKHIFEGSALLFSFSEENKDVLKIYFRYLGTNTPIGKIIAEAEAIHNQTLARAISGSFGIPKNEAEHVAELLLAIRFGTGARYALTGMKSRISDEAYVNAIRRVFKQGFRFFESA